MKKNIFLSFSAAAVIVFTGCGGGGGSSSSSSNTSTPSVKTSEVKGNVVDGPIAYAKVCVDENFNQVCDSNEPTAMTDINGSYVLSKVNLALNAPLLVEPIKNKTFDTVTKEEFTKKLSAPLDSSKVNINPITTLIGAKLYKLKKENNLTQEALKKVKEEVAKAFGIEPDKITQEDITKNPKLYAKAVVIAKVIDDLDKVDEKIDFEKLKEGNLTEAIKDGKAKELIEVVEKEDFNNTDITLIQEAIEKAIEQNTTIDMKNLKALGLEAILTQNRIFKQYEDGYEIVFNSDKTFLDYTEYDGVKKGIWDIEDSNVVLRYDDGGILYIKNIKQINPYMYKIVVDDTAEPFEDIVLVIPKGKKINELPGISFIQKEMIENKMIDLEDEQIIFYADGVYEEKNNLNSAKGSWKIENGILKVEGVNVDSNKSFSAEVVLFKDKFLAIVNEDGVNKGFVFPAKLKDINNSTPNGFNKELVSDKTFAFEDTQGDYNFLIIRKDGTWIRYKENVEVDNGIWSIEDGRLKLHSLKDNKDIFVTLKQNLGDVLEVEFDSISQYVVVLHTKYPNAKITSSDDLKSLNFLVGKNPFTSDMIAGKSFKTKDGSLLTLNSDGVFSITWQENGKNYTATGKWNIDSNGVLVLNFDKSELNIPDVVYVVLGKLEGLKVEVFMVKNSMLVGASVDKLEPYVISNTTPQGFSEELVKNKTFAFDERFVVVKEDKSWEMYVNGAKLLSGSWEINDGILVLHSSSGDYKVSLKENLGSVLKVEFDGKEIYVAILDTTNPFIKVSSSNDLKQISSIVGKNKFNQDVLKGKTFVTEEEKIVLKEDNTFEITSDNQTSTGTWSVDSNGVLVLNFDNDEVDSVYVVLGEVDGNVYKVLTFSVKNSTLIDVTPDIITSL